MLSLSCCRRPSLKRKQAPEDVGTAEQHPPAASAPAASAAASAAASRKQLDEVDDTPGPLPATFSVPMPASSDSKDAKKRKKKHKKDKDKDKDKEKSKKHKHRQAEVPLKAAAKPLDAVAPAEPLHTAQVQVAEPQLSVSVREAAASPMQKEGERPAHLCCHLRLLTVQYVQSTCSPYQSTALVDQMHQHRQRQGT